MHNKSYMSISTHICDNITSRNFTLWHKLSKDNKAPAVYSRYGLNSCIRFLANFIPFIVAKRFSKPVTILQSVCPNFLRHFWDAVFSRLPAAIMCYRTRRGEMSDTSCWRFRSCPPCRCSSSSFRSSPSASKLTRACEFRWSATPAYSSFHRRSAPTSFLLFARFRFRRRIRPSGPRRIGLFAAGCWKSDERSRTRRSSSSSPSATHGLPSNWPSGLLSVSVFSALLCQTPAKTNGRTNERTDGQRPTIEFGAF